MCLKHIGTFNLKQIYIAVKIKKHSLLGLLMCAAIAITSACDDTTDTLGTSLMPEHDIISTSTETYKISSKTQVADSVLANTSTCYLGSVVDPETKAKTTCDFMAQFHVHEKFQMPQREKMLLDENNEIIIDSCDIRIYFDSYYGDSLTSMKLMVQELDTANVIEEGVKYYTNINPTQYLNPDPNSAFSMTYAVKDFTRPSTETDGSTYYRSIRVPLKSEYGKGMIDKYYQHPEYYRNSYTFIHHVCPGFYFKIAGGVGSMIKTVITTLNVYFRYHTINEAGRDTLIAGLQRMAATEEVIQTTRVENKLPTEMTNPNNAYSYIKSPAALYTELTLPISDIVSGEHYNDTINSASFSIRCYPMESQNKYTLAPSPTVLLIRKSEQYSFFEKKKLTSTDAYIAKYNSQYKSYTFDNVSQLIKILRDERDNGAGITPIDTEEQREAKFAIWEANNPDWNKLVLLPVAAQYSTSNSYAGASQTLTRLNNELGMYSTKLEGGSNSINLQVIYTRFKQ